MKKEFTNELVFKMELNNLIRSLNSNNPHTVYNIFCHHINDGQELLPEQIGKLIMEKGLKCGYSTVSRTLTYMGTSRDFQVDRIFKYSYTATNYKNRTVAVLAIPKYVKLNSGEYVDFSTPEGNQFGWKQRCYSALDKIKDPYAPLPTYYNLCLMHIDEQSGKFVLTDNEKHIGRVKERTRQPIIKAIKNAIDAYNSAEMHKNSLIK